MDQILHLCKIQQRLPQCLKLRQIQYLHPLRYPLCECPCLRAAMEAVLKQAAS